ncbi:MULTISPECIES: CaiB/BaiF CoA transferase family protein [Brevundimonas]|uniref:Alpha-methylacyl-CoA racemase n=2 Tax=Brevundimonas TaxID=41275 RepID=A0A8E0KJA6_9CAUL|nr:MULTISPECIES: CaiB/BaiF CoA-transferase family protein [Brevundimonas]GAD59256.1 alpha-methylacyl-CoA racemase [Brevundimonas abyssalis TAR-001]
MSQGPLNGLRVVEFAGIGPAPFCATLLSDLGAEVLRIDRPGGGAALHDVTARGRAGSLALDLKAEADRAAALQAIAAADVLVEGFRPGVMERLGLGPDEALAANPRLIYGRMTGWGQTGPLAHAAGHDINYIAVTGALDAIGPKGGDPVPPLNLVGDYGGGALYLAMGILAALHERQTSGKGQVIDAAVVDGTVSLMGVFSWLTHDGLTSMKRGEGLLNGAMPFYRTYACADGRHVSVGPLEPAFYLELRTRLGLTPQPAGDMDQQAAELAAVFLTQPRDHWTALLEGTDACFAPVLSLDEAPAHPHLAARESFTEAFGVTQPAPAPRFSRTPGAIQGPPAKAGENGQAVLARWSGGSI